MAIAIPTRTVTVNAAFLQEIKEVHEELWRLLDHIRGRLQEALNERPRRRHLLDLLERLRDQLALQFALEEAYGYFEDPAYVAPRLSDQAMALRAEHRELYDALTQLVEDAQTWEDEGRQAVFRSDMPLRFEEFDRRLLRHEALEVALIQQQYSDDIGVGD